MLQAEDDLLHRESTFTNDPRGVEQHEAPHQAQYQMPIVSIFTVRLTGTGCEQMLQGPKAVLDPVAPLPGPDEPWPTDGRIETHHVELLLSGLTDDDDRHRTICRTGRTQPRIVHPRHLLARPPRPPAVLLQVLSLDLAPIGQFEDIGTLPFHKECALMRGGHMAHELRIAEPTIRHDHRWGQLDAASAEGCHASIEHALHPTEFVTTRSARPLRIRATDGKIHGDHEFALTNDDHQEEPINT